jgi:hypothetical protein
MGAISFSLQYYGNSCHKLDVVYAQLATAPDIVFRNWANIER